MIASTGSIIIIVVVGYTNSNNNTISKEDIQVISEEKNCIEEFSSGVGFNKAIGAHSRSGPPLWAPQRRGPG